MIKQELGYLISEEEAKNYQRMKRFIRNWGNAKVCKLCGEYYPSQYCCPYCGFDSSFEPTEEEIKNFNGES
jgi:ribosomal protein L32